MKKGGFKYRGTSETTVKDRATRSGGAFDRWTDPRIPTFRPKDGENNIRILPRTWDDTDKWEDSWGIRVYIHNNIGVDKSSYLCRAKMLGEECALCDARADLDEEKDEDAINQLRPTERILCYIIDRNDTKAGPMLYSMPQSKIEREIQVRCNKAGILKVDHPEEGYDISFTKRGSGLKTEYSGVDIARDSTPLTTKEERLEKWLGFVEENPIPETLIFKDNEDLENIYRGKTSSKSKSEEDEDEDAPSKSSKRHSSREEEDEDEPKSDRDRDKRSRSREEDEETERGSSRSSKRSAREEEDEDEPEAKSERVRRKPKDEEEEDEEDERPAKKTTSKKTSKVEDEEEEEEEERKPAKKSDKTDRSSQAKASVDRLKKRHVEEEDDD